MGQARGTTLVVAGALLGALIVALCGCTETADPQSAPPTSSPTPTAEPSASAGPVWSLDDARVDRVPDDPPLVESALPASFPADDAVLPDLLADPPGAALVTYHPRESFDPGAWVSERVLFLGTDGAWRSLEMVDLGLPEPSHPGPDTYGAGELSPDGTRWAAKTNAGIVLVDLRTGQSRAVPLPGQYTAYLAWRPDGRRLDVVRLHGQSGNRTWSVDPRSLRTTRAAYRLPIDGYARDGSVVVFSSQGGETVRTVHRDGTQVADVTSLPPRPVRLGGAVGATRTLFGLNRDLLVVDSTSTAPLARLRLGRRDAAGWPRGWWDEDTVWFSEGSRGLLTWNVVTGELGTLTRVRPGTRPDSYWSTSVAVDLMR